MDAFVLVHPSSKRLAISNDSSSRGIKRQSNVCKAFIEAIQRCKYLEVLNISGFDDKSSEFPIGSDVREFYLHKLGDALTNQQNLTILNLGSFANNSIFKTLSESCQNLRELYVSGPLPELTDLGLRYIAGQIPTSSGAADQGSMKYQESGKRTGCLMLQKLCLDKLEKVSLATLSTLLLHMEDLRVLDHSKLHEALWLMKQAGALEKIAPLKLTGIQNLSYFD